MLPMILAYIHSIYSLHWPWADVHLCELGAAAGPALPGRQCAPAPWPHPQSGCLQHIIAGRGTRGHHTHAVLIVLVLHILLPLCVKGTVYRGHYEDTDNCLVHLLCLKVLHVFHGGFKSFTKLGYGMLWNEYPAGLQSYRFMAPESQTINHPILLHELLAPNTPLQ